MKHPFLTIQFHGSAACFAMVMTLALTPLLLGQDDAQKHREQIGQVLGKPVYRDEIRVEKDVRLSDELHRVFTSPVMQAYRIAHKADTEPTEEEIDAATAFFDARHREQIKEEEPKLRERLKAVEERLVGGDLTEAEQRKLKVEAMALHIKLKPPGRSFAVFMLSNWKFQRHLYDRYGGGRVLWQQAGMEAFDAMHKWLEASEKNGDFKITDPQLRTSFYEYWTTMNHGSFLIEDKERIRAEFLEPEWLSKRPDNP